MPVAIRNRFAIPAGVELKARVPGGRSGEYLSPLTRPILMCEGRCGKITAHNAEEPTIVELDVGAKSIYVCEECGCGRAWG